MLSRSELRQQMRVRRQQLSPQGQNKMAEKIVDQVCNSPIFYQSTHISAYIAHAGEIDPAPILRLAWQLKKICYLPVMQTQKQLCFVKYESEDELIPNSYKILEPIIHPDKIIQPALLDLVLVPLVAFDRKGNRLGMGSGYFDVTFSFLKTAKRPTKPYLLGLAYEWQQCETISPEEWDIKLDAVATENTIHLTY